MTWLCISLIAVAFAVSCPMTVVMRSLGRRLRALDAPGVPGQVKAPPRGVPNTGGLALYLGIVLPIAAALLAIRTPLLDLVVERVPALAEHIPGLIAQAGSALVLLTGLTVLHVMGVIDDRRPLGPWVKLVAMLAVAVGVVLGTESRLLTLLDAHAGGPWLSLVLTVLWLGLVTNAMNFMDNMDGLTGGVTAIASACFLAATLSHAAPQWFVAACLALVLGSCLGFLVFNFPRPRATIFMGDGGSLVLGFMLGFLTVRTTYVGADLAGGWYAVFMPLVVLAVPLYDLASVCVIRIRAGRSPLVGDLNHLSHRLVRRGLCQRDAVLVIYGLTGITAIGGISLASLLPWQAMLVGVQVALVLLVLAIYEGRAAEPKRD